MADPVDFWFSVGSTYTYLTVMRLAQIERVSGIPFRWRPFSVRAIMKEMNNIPFGNKPIKAAYMWRDIERRAEMYGVPIKVPAPYPLIGTPYISARRSISRHMYAALIGLFPNGMLFISFMVARTLNGRHRNGIPLTRSTSARRMTVRYV